jgi:hypothetical protein
MSCLQSDVLRKCYSVKCQNLDQLSDVTHEYLKEDIQHQKFVQLGYHCSQTPIQSHPLRASESV